MTIKTIEELIAFLDEHWDRLTDDQYCEILQKTLSVFELDKPKDKGFAIKLIENHYALIKDMKSELPLFLDHENV
jgi:hypothetical protein